ncbi:MAG TPA: carboxypeptidase regulatory-like domain-containing protein [Vicinamibacterales bacterium]|nr:carboxypeptidase regulatory-like domain-containing protein [Vicinamibacterales bacterium]
MTAIAVLVGLAALLTQPQLPARDRPVTKPGTASVRGYVVDAHTGSALPRVLVRLSAQGTEGASAYTDAEGRFEFRDVGPAKYTLFADKVPYLPMAYGQTSLESSPTVLEVTDGQVVEKLKIALLRGGVITGRVFDEYGHPAPGVQIRVMQYGYEGGARRLREVYGRVGPQMTDDLGAFRVYGLRPGQYFVSAQLAGFATSGSAVETSGPVPTFYPNSVDPAGAQRVTVVAAKEAGGVNITLMSGRLAAIRGRAFMASGEPFAGGHVRIMRGDGSGFSQSFGGLVKPDGSFQVTGVTPGSYLVSVRPMNARDDTDIEVARAAVTVAGEDVDNLMLVGSRGAVVRGVVTTDEGMLPAAKGSQISVMVLSPPGELSEGVRPAPLNDDYSFELKGVFGRRRLEVNAYALGGSGGGGATWALKQVFLRGEDVTGRFFDFEPNQTLEGLELVLSRRWAELSGTITDDRGRAAPNVNIVLFPADEAKWSANDFRRLRSIRTGADGAYRMPMLPGGEYLIAITGRLEPGQYQDPDFLRTLADRATRVIVADGETKTQNLRISSIQ